MSQPHVEGLTERETYDLLWAYTVTHADPDFVHQHVVDTFAAQAATAWTKPIALAMSLVGLYLAWVGGEAQVDAGAEDRANAVALERPVRQHPVDSTLTFCTGGAGSRWAGRRFSRCEDGWAGSASAQWAGLDAFPLWPRELLRD